MLADYDAAIGAGEAWVLEEDGGLAGVLVARPGEDHLFVETVAVQPERQGGGLGRRLMTFAEDEALRLGLDEVRLYTNEKMRENFSFYGGLGFEETGRRTEDGYRRVFMRKQSGRGCGIWAGKGTEG